MVIINSLAKATQMVMLLPLKNYIDEVSEKMQILLLIA